MSNAAPPSHANYNHNHNHHNKDNNNNTMSVDETLASIEVMRRQEDVSYKVGDYLAQLPASTDVDAPVDMQCRMVMQKWCKDIAQYCNYNVETVEVAMSCLDRFMSTPAGYEVLLDRNQYQLAVMTALYTAVKVHEHEAMDPKLVSSLSQGTHSPEAVESMELRMLAAIQWRVNPPTAMSFVNMILGLVPDHMINQEERQAIIDLTKFQVDLASEQYEFSLLPASYIGISSLLNAVESVSTDQIFVADFEPSVCRVVRVEPRDLRKVRIHLYESINGVEPMDLQFTNDDEDLPQQQQHHNASGTDSKIHPDMMDSRTSPRAINI